MTDQELLQLLGELESDRVERKASLGGDAPEKARRTICAFANDMAGRDLPGVLFIGAHDDGSPSGAAVDERMLLSLSDMRSDGNITPPPTMSVEKRTLGGHDFAVAIVQPSLAPPVRYKGQTWIRVGPRLAVASVEEEMRLAERRRGRDVPFELQPAPIISLDDLDMLLFREYLRATVAPDVLEQNQRTHEQQLLGLRFATVDGGVLCPTVLGALALALDPRQAIPGAYVQFVRVDGDSLDGRFTDQKELSGPISQVLRRLDELLELSVSVSTDIVAASMETRTHNYPIVALQQVVRNALMHRTYQGTHAPVRLYWFSDRVEVHSPGGPYGMVTVSAFGQTDATDYRNPGLAGIMHDLGYVQRFGAGIPLTRSAMKRNGNPEPEFVATETHVAVTLRRRP